MLELIIAVTLLIVGLIPTVSLIINLRRGIEDRDVEINTLLSGQSLLEIIKAKKWDENSVVPAGYVTAPSAIGADTGESMATLYDDVDDYNGFTDQPDSYTTRTVSVKYVNVPLNGSVSDSATPTDFKFIKVSIQKTGPHPVSQEVQTIMSNTP